MAGQVRLGEVQPRGSVWAVTTESVFLHDQSRREGQSSVFRLFLSLNSFLYFGGLFSLRSVKVWLGKS
jgi:hypothetical protein